MSTDLPQPTHSLNEAPQTATLTRIVRFLHVVRVRKGLLFTALFIAVLLAGLYYATAPRLYESSSRLYVLQMGSNVLDEAMEKQGGVRENMANYQGVLTSDLVLEEVLHDPHACGPPGPPKHWFSSYLNVKFCCAASIRKYRKASKGQLLCPARVASPENR